MGCLASLRSHLNLYLLCFHHIFNDSSNQELISTHDGINSQLFQCLGFKKIVLGSGRSDRRAWSSHLGPETRKNSCNSSRFREERHLESSTGEIIRHSSWAEDLSLDLPGIVIRLERQLGVYKMRAWHPLMILMKYLDNWSVVYWWKNGLPVV